MTDDTPTDIDDRLTALENRVQALETKLEDDASGRADGGIDRYDGYVLDRIEDIGTEPSPRQVVHLYHEAGVRDRSKIKERHKFLRRSGRIEQALAKPEGENE